MPTLPAGLDWTDAATQIEAFLAIPLVQGIFLFGLAVICGTFLLRRIGVIR